MQRTVWLLVGLLIGAGGMWAYATQVREPALVAQTTQAVKEMVEADRIATSNELRGAVTSADDETGIFVIKANMSGSEKMVTVKTDMNTKFYKLTPESSEGRELIGASLIVEGAEVLVTLRPSGDETDVYATEVTLF